MRKVLLTLLLLLAAWQASFSQTKNIGIKEGLSNGFVDDMVIDGQGFVWVATEWGLNRIAGNKCTVFNPSNSNISNNEHVGLFYHPQSNTTGFTPRTEGPTSSIAKHKPSLISR